jgi:hypothetical protein
MIRHFELILPKLDQLDPRKIQLRPDRGIFWRYLAAGTEHGVHYGRFSNVWKCYLQCWVR